LDWFHVGGMPRGDAACQERGEDHEQRRGDESPRVVGRNLVEHAREQPYKGECSSETKEETCEDKPDSLANHHAYDSRARCAESDADADLRNALTNGVGEQTIEADQCEQQGAA